MHDTFPMRVALAIAILVGTGCAIGTRHQYRDVVAALQASGSGTVAVATHDEREYILNGDKKPDFVGLQRGGYGNPFDVRTASGRPLAEDMTDAIAASLRLRGFQATPVTVAHTENASAVRQRLIDTRADRAVLLILNEWKADSMTNTELIFSTTLRVLDRAGHVLAEKNLIGSDNLGGSFWNPPAHARKAVPEAFRAKLETLLNSPEVAAALSGTPPG